MNVQAKFTSCKLEHSTFLFVSQSLAYSKPFSVKLCIRQFSLKLLNTWSASLVPRLSWECTIYLDPLIVSRNKGYRV